MRGHAKVQWGLFALVVLALLGSCSIRVDAGRLLVVVDTDIPEVDQVTFDITAPDGRRDLATLHLRPGLPASRWIHKAEQEPRGAYEAVVTGLSAGRAVIAREASLWVVAGEARVVTLHLVRSCVGVRCPGDLVCAEQGCRMRLVAQSELEPWSGAPPVLSPTDSSGTPAPPDSGAVTSETVSPVTGAPISGRAPDTAVHSNDASAAAPGPTDAAPSPVRPSDPSSTPAPDSAMPPPSGPLPSPPAAPTPASDAAVNPTPAGDAGPAPTPASDAGPAPTLPSCTGETARCDGERVVPCVNGLPGPPQACPATSACLRGTCDAARGCVAVPVADGTACGTDLTCRGGVCGAGTSCEGDCSPRCDRNSGNCQVDCGASGANCKPSCESGSTCQIDCDETSNCDVRCRGACGISCAQTSNCEVRCEPGADCQIDCRSVAGNCEKIRCDEGARCLLRCGGSDNCEFERCAAGATQCGNGDVVCQRECPR